MAKTASKMICPDCGVEMNHHCDKLVYATDPQDMAKVDPAMGGLIEEFHTCPKCGGVASRAPVPQCV
jgi:ribosomal protein S27AE